MKILLDTSVLVAAMVKTHPAHVAAADRLKRVRQRQDVGIVAAHSLAETYAILTTLPIQPKITPGLAHQLIQQDIVAICEIVPLTTEEYLNVIAQLEQQQLCGGITYDALLLAVGIKTQVAQIVTLNAKDFRRIFPELIEKIVAP